MTSQADDTMSQVTTSASPLEKGSVVYEGLCQNLRATRFLPLHIEGLVAAVAAVVCAALCCHITSQHSAAGLLTSADHEQLTICKSGHREVRSWQSYSLTMPSLLQLSDTGGPAGTCGHACTHGHHQPWRLKHKPIQLPQQSVS